METEQRLWLQDGGWNPSGASGLGGGAQLALVFGAGHVLRRPELLNDVRAFYPGALLFGCSTSGEILGDRIHDGSLVVTAVHFAATRLKVAHALVARPGDSRRVASTLAAELAGEDLVHILLLSDGLGINGTELVRGFTESLPRGVTVTGGLAGDSTRFAETFVLCDGLPRRNAVAALGLYSRDLAVGYGSMGGWDPFGPERLVTRSEGNVLFELDGRSALDLYKTYLGDLAEGLPATALLFPLSLRFSDADEHAVVRTVLAVDEKRGSMTFAGDIPEGTYGRFMKANYDRLVDGAQEAAQSSAAGLGNGRPELALCVSCVGRKLVLKQRIEEELEAVCETLGTTRGVAGFYSYGEISPIMGCGACELHNQTMTVTVFREGQCCPAKRGSAISILDL